MNTNFYRPKAWTASPSTRAKLQRDRAARRYKPDPFKNERYTPGETVAHGAQLAEVKRFDLDVAACAESFIGSRFYDKAQNGLEQRWHGVVWCNPPYDDCGAWVSKAWKECRASHHEISIEVPPVLEAIVMLLPATRSEQPWWQNEVEPYRDGRKVYPGSGLQLQVHFLPGRVSFGAPRGKRLGPSPFPLVFLIWR